MGTRSLTFVYTDDDEPLVCMYRQYDGTHLATGLNLVSFSPLESW